MGDREFEQRGVAPGTILNPDFHNMPGEARLVLSIQWHRRHQSSRMGYFQSINYSFNALLCSPKACSFQETGSTFWAPMPQKMQTQSFWGWHSFHPHAPESQLRQRLRASRWFWPGDEVTSLRSLSPAEMQVVECTSCILSERNTVVWVSLGMLLQSWMRIYSIFLSNYLNKKYQNVPRNTSYRPCMALCHSANPIHTHRINVVSF